jgi:hypothetical protein
MVQDYIAYESLYHDQIVVLSGPPYLLCINNTRLAVLAKVFRIPSAKRPVLALVRLTEINQLAKQGKDLWLRRCQWTEKPYFNSI